MNIPRRGLAGLRGLASALLLALMAACAQTPPTTAPTASPAGSSHRGECVAGRRRSGCAARTSGDNTRTGGRARRMARWRAFFFALARRALTLRVLVEERLVERSAEMGAYFKAGLESIRSNRVREIRGRGLMLAVEIHAEAGAARPVVEALRDQGILAKDTHGQTIRLSPPLVISRDEIDWALERIETVLR